MKRLLLPWATHRIARGGAAFAIAAALAIAPSEAEAGPCDIGICLVDDISNVVLTAPRTIAVTLDHLPFVELTGSLELTYTPSELLRRVRKRQLSDLDEASYAVRLIISEVGADRLLKSAHGLEEALAILHTVGNRLDPAIYDPDGAGVKPYEGCGPLGSFNDCANPIQYLGMATSRALKPLEAYNRDMIIDTTDIAFVAWTLYNEGLVPDFTGGATVYVHRCGGTAYGRSTWHCDGNDSRGIQDIRGANPHTGPMVLSAPISSADGGGQYLASRGYYNIRRTHTVDYEIFEPKPREPIIVETMPMAVADVPDAPEPTAELNGLPPVEVPEPRAAEPLAMPDESSAELPTEERPSEPQEQPDGEGGLWFWMENLWRD